MKDKSFKLRFVAFVAISSGNFALQNQPQFRRKEAFASAKARVMSMTVTHKSDLEEYRSPLGAIKTDETVKLRIKIEDEKPLDVRLCLFINEVAMELSMVEKGDYWEVSIKAPKTPLVLWYYFLIDIEVTEEIKKTYYYGAVEWRNFGEGSLYDSHCASFQLTVYEKSFTVPEWFCGKTMYQIFPDRFCMGNEENMKKGARYHSKMHRQYFLHEKWRELPLYEPLEGSKDYSPCDFFGGDLRGIINKLPYLKELNITTVYLNPIVEAASNHRYDASDYKKIDRFLGTDADFIELCEKAEKKGIHIMLDGVFSHTGSDSFYFNKMETYESKGAYQGEASPFYKWYTFFDNNREKYKCWWGFDTLPEVNEHDESWQDYIIKSDNSVLAHWSKMGARGMRLDVADELPDDVLALIRKHWKKNDSKNVLLGEVWEDATTKKSYGVNRSYALGVSLDSVMNYPFRDATLAFLQGQINAEAYSDFFKGQKQNYPQPMYHALMNLMSSHDVPRMRTVLSTGKTGENMSREEQVALTVSPQEEILGAGLQRLAVAVQFTAPGVPCIYYGDEYGMHGLKDPFNRGAFAERDKGLISDYYRLTKARSDEEVLQKGNASFFHVGEDIFGILRILGNNVIIALINRGKACETAVNLAEITSGLSKNELSILKNRQIIFVENVLTGVEADFVDNSVSAFVDAKGYSVWKVEL